MQYPEFLITTAGQTLINQAIANKTTLTDYSIWSKAGTSSFNANTTDIPGLSFMGVPSLLTSADGSQTYAVIHLMGPLLTPFTYVLKVGSTIVGLYNFAPSDMSITMVVIRLTNVPAALFGADVIKNDYISNDSLHVVLDDIAAKYSQRLPTLYEGNILFGTSTATSPVSEPMLKEIAVVESAEEFTKATQNTVSMAEVFNTWYRFSHSGSVNYPALPAELNGWSLNAQGEISSTINSSSYIGFVSPTKHSNFELDVQLRSTNGDDDANGVVIAFLKEDGREFTISAMRTLGGWFSGVWKLYYNVNQGDALLLGTAEDDLVWGDGVLGKNRAAAGPYVQNGGWNRADIASGTRIRVTRNGDIITAETSNFGSTALVPSKLTLNLASLPILARFRKPASYGYSSLSQANSFYNTTSMVDKENVIVDMTTNSVLSYDGTNWINTGATLAQTVGVNQFVYSKVNKSTYYIDSAGTISRVI